MPIVKVHRLQGHPSEENRGILAAVHDALVAAFKASGAKLACLCSSDAVYVRQAADAAKMLTAGGAIVHLAGRPGDHEAAWRQVGVKSFIYAGCDALSTLQAAHDILDVK